MNDVKRDVEETDSVLDSLEGDPVDFWEQKQRELVTSVVDYNLGALADLITTEAIDLAPKYQRRFRWDQGRQSRLIESFLMNVPVPPIFLNEDSYGTYSVIDGKQRLTAIHEFFRGRLTLSNLNVFSDINGKTIDDLPSKLQTVLKTRPTLRTIIILRQSDDDVKFEVFQRLNTGGVSLNPQEIRNSTYPGALNDAILELSETKQFHRLLGIKNKVRSAIYQEMRDAEFVLRFFTFRTTWQTFSGGMRRHMDRFMALTPPPTVESISQMKEDFLRTLEVVENAFGEHAFHRWVPHQHRWRNQVLASMYDAQMFAAREFQSDQVAQHRAAIIEEQKTLFENPTFARSIDAATNTPSSFQARIQMVREMLLQATA